jgi:primary-amine oxidase
MRVSITRKQVISFDASEFSNFPLPAPSAKSQNYTPAAEARTSVKPLHITQPKGASFTITDENRVQWQGWDFQVGFNSREGITLHHVSMDGRPIIHKMSVTEMVVPYGDPRKPHALKAAFDAGEDGFGRNANSLKLGCDCLGHIEYLDANLVDDAGEPETIQQAVCIHEEDASIAWKHTCWKTGDAQVRRGRKLVVSFITTVANYDYGFYYEFMQDGRIALDVKLTGVLSTGLLSHADSAAGGRKYGTTLTGSLYAPIHQHFFCARIHPAIDGDNNTVTEANVVVEDIGPENPLGNAFYYEEKDIVTETGRDDCLETGRVWGIRSSDRKNTTGKNTAFKLAAATPCKPLANINEAKQLNRAGFLKHSLWVTAFDPDERFPAGEYPNQCPEEDGLTKWTQRGRATVDADIVLWYSFGVTHQPRLEDFPVMPVEHTGFHLKPSGFFDVSPVMDLPR